MVYEREEVKVGCVVEVHGFPTEEYADGRVPVLEACESVLSRKARWPLGVQ